MASDDGIEPELSKWLIDELHTIKASAANAQETFDDRIDDLIDDQNDQIQLCQALLANVCGDCYYLSQQISDAAEKLHAKARTLRTSVAEARQECISRLDQFADNIYMGTSTDSESS